LSTLTELTLRNLKPPARGQILYADTTLPGFGVRVSQGGTKTFTLLFGRPRQRITIGRYPVVSLSAARQRAREILAEHTLGKTRPKTISFDEAVSLFLSERQQRTRPSTMRGYTCILRKHFPFMNRRLTDITVEDIRRCIEPFRTAPVQRDYTLRVIKMLFRWAVRNRYLEYSPCDALTVVRRPARERVLTDAELRTVFSTALKGDDTFSAIVALLILLGQRRTETASLRRQWIDLQRRTISLPASITKNKRPHTFPYGKLAAAIIDKLPDQGDLLFPARCEHVRGVPTEAFTGWSKSKSAFDKKCPIAPWTLHDLRRTFATGHAAIGTPPHIVERMLNHASGIVSGVAAIYNRYAYMDEMREAIQNWEKHLKRIVAPVRLAA
jgi:integrase